MCKTSDDTFKTSYQRAHFYENVIDDKLKNVRTKPKVRPDLYVYDNIVNKKCSTYNKHYGEQKTYEKPSEFHGRCYFASKYSYKNIYNDFHSKRIGTLKNDATSSGIHYNDPRNTAEAKLLHDFDEKISKEEEEKPGNLVNYTEFVHPYVSMSKSQFRDCTESFLNGIAKNDIITYYNKKVKNKIPPKKIVYEVEPKFPMKVPFFGDTSVYRESYRDPKKKDAFLSEVCLTPGYWESIKTDASTIPKMYSTEQKQIGSCVKNIV